MKTTRKQPTNGGFALVITLTLMILLVILAVGMLTLSSVSLRTSHQGEAMAVARNNAHLGLMLAIGELQKELGPDQKITAPSSILNPPTSTTSLNHSHLTGIWTSRQETLATPPNYDLTRPFVKWLVSSAKLADLKKLDFAKTGTFASQVLIAGAHGSEPTYAGKVPLTNNITGMPGDCAWWVADENCKGFTNPVDSLTVSAAVPSVPDIMAAAGTPSAGAMKVMDKDYPVNSDHSAKVLSHGQLALAASAGVNTRDWFHDLSPYSQGLLTNVVSGGLRQDLNLALEQMPSQAGVRVPAVVGPNGKYALSLVDGSGNDGYDVLSWKYLHTLYHLKERIQLVGDRPTMVTWNGSAGVTPDDLINPAWNTGVLRPTPVLVRAVIFLAFGSIRNPANPTANPPEYVLRFYAKPVITLWNPFNVDLQVQSRQLHYLFTSLPMGHKISVNGNFIEDFTWRGSKGGVGYDGANNYTGAGVEPILNETITLQAGEAKMLSSTHWYTNSHVTLHQLHDMKAVPFIYSSTAPGGLWGGSTSEGCVSGDQVIKNSKGGAADTVKLETHVNMWDLDGGAFHRQYPATFDIRGQHANDGNDGPYTTFEWGQKVGWLYESTVPNIATPDKLTRANLPSATFGDILNAPKPFMVVDVQLKALDETDLPNKTWRDCIPSHAYQAVTQLHTDVTPYFANAYKLRFDTINSYQEASSYLQIAPDNPTHTYFGGSYFPANGQSYITDREIPLAPFTSLAQLQHVPQASCDNLYSSGLHFQNRAIGNSFASPGVPADQVKSTGWPFNGDVYMNSSGGTIDGIKYPGNQFFTRPNIDRSYAANQLLWDDYFFSSMSAKNDVLRAGTTKTIDKCITDFYKSGILLPNERYKPCTGNRTPAAVIALLVRGATLNTTGYQKVAAYLTVDGSFNVNSTSVTAWKTMIAAAHQKKWVTLVAGGKPAASGSKNYVVSRYVMPNAGSTVAGQAPANLEWQGYHELTEAQIGELAEACVRQVKLRGPFRSLAEFINRRLAPESDARTKYGALQAALEDPGVSINAKYRSPEITAAKLPGNAYQNKSAALGPIYQGCPPYVTQADILNSIGPVLSARSDSFLVRAYGQSRDASGKILASAWCEAVVQRVPSYLDPKDVAETPLASLTSQVNKSFGRRFNIISFRWLSNKEL